MGSRQVEEAMARLGDEQRALVELSVVRGISDEEIGGYLGTSAEQVAERREAALDGLVADAGDGFPDDRARVVAVLQGEPEPEPAPQFEPDPEPSPEPEPEPVVDTRPLSEALPASAPEVRFRPVPVLLIGLALLALTVLVLELSATDDSVEPQGPVAQPATRPGALQPLVPGSEGRGTARIGDDRLVLSVSGLPAPAGGGGYVVWLYDDVTDARSLSGALRGSFRVNAPLPEGYERYRFVDVSREPADGNRNHSGQSVLRVPLRSIEP